MLVFTSIIPGPQYHPKNGGSQCSGPPNRQKRTAKIRIEYESQDRSTKNYKKHWNMRAGSLLAPGIGVTP